MNAIRSVVFFTVLYSSVFVFGAALFLVTPFGRSACYRVARGWVRMNLWVARVVCGLRYEVSGQENIPDRNCVAYLKHSSTWEALAELLVFPEQTWVVKRELYWIPYFGQALIFLRPIAIDRGAHATAVRQVLQKGSKAMRKGLWVMIFPEGTRMAPGTTRRYGMSGALLALENDRPIVPVAHNAEDFWPRHSLSIRPGTVRMVIGPPIATTGREPAEINREAQDWIEGTMRRISASYTPSLSRC